MICWHCGQGYDPREAWCPYCSRPSHPPPELLLAASMERVALLLEFAILRDPDYAPSPKVQTRMAEISERLWPDTD